MFYKYPLPKFSCKALTIFTTLLLMVFIVQSAQANILLSGKFHAGDNYFSDLTPPDPVTYAQLDDYPIQFKLSKERTLTGVELLNVKGLENNSNLRIFIDGEKIATGGDGETSVSFSPETLQAGLHNCSVRGSCYKNDKESNKCKNKEKQDEDDFDFEDVIFFSEGSEKILNFIERIHLGDYGGQTNWYDPTTTYYPYYPDDPQGESITFSFSLDKTAYGLYLDFYRLRALDAIADIELNGVVEANLDPDSDESYNLSNDPYSVLINKTLEPDDYTITISSGYISSDNVDDFSWDELIITPQKPPQQSLLTYYAMEESSWDGTPGEVADSSGNNHNATTDINANPQISDPALSGDPGTCRYGVFNGENDYLKDSDATNYLDGLSAITVMAWVKNTDNIGNDRGIFGTAPANVNDNRLGLRYDNQGASTGNSNLIKASLNTNACDDDNDCLQVETESDLQVRDEWQHIAMTWRSGEKIRIYVNGTEVVTNVTSSGIGVHEGNLDGIDFLRIGQGVKQGSTSPYWQGSIDEFRIYAQTLNTSQIQNIMNKRHPCDISALDHFAIIHDGHAVNCQRERVKIEAQDENNNTVTDYTGTISLSTNSSHGDWYRIETNGNLENYGSGDGEYTFSPSDKGNATLGLRNTYIETVDIDVKDGPTNEDPDQDPPLVFERTGFEITNSTSTDPAAFLIDTQISSKPSDQAPNSQDLQLMAVNSTNGTSCQAALNGTVQVKMAFECIDPNTCSGRQVAINGTNGWQSIQGFDKGNVNMDTSSEVSLDFGDEADATAPFDLNYPDAGKIKLHARYELEQNGTPSGNYMYGASNKFVVRPFGFDIDVSGDSNATNANSSVFKTAGANFTVQIQAVGWQSGQDEDDDGIPDHFEDQNPTNNVDLSDNENTPNFDPESSVEITSYLWKPTNGTHPGLSGGTAVDVNNGSGFTGVYYDEVGILGIKASLSDYLGSGEDVLGAVDHPVGRFVPDHFNVTIDNNGTLEAKCSNSFTYIGQNMTYADEPKLSIEAQNTANETTNNYNGSFVHLEAKEVYINATKHDVDKNGTNNKPLTIEADIKNKNGTIEDKGGLNGTVIYKLSSNDIFRYVHNASSKVDSFYANLNLNATKIYDDKDGINALGNAPYAIIEPLGVQMRFGRLNIKNAYGSELLDLKVPIRAQYYDNGGFVLNRDDQCSRLSINNSNNTVKMELKNDSTGWQSANQDIALAGDQASGSTEGLRLNNGTDQADNLKLGKGAAYLVLEAPGQDKTGYVHVRAFLDDYPWLQYDWNGDGSHDENPNATATFGIYKGNEHIIYQQETTWK